MLCFIFGFVIFDMDLANATVVPETMLNWGLHNANIFEAQKLVADCSSVAVGVLDTGVEIENEFLKYANVLESTYKSNLDKKSFIFSISLTFKPK